MAENLSKGRALMYAKALAWVSQQEGLRGKQTAKERGARYLSLGVRLADPTQIKKALAIGQALATATNTPVVLIQRSGAIIHYQFQLAYSYWEEYTRADLKTEPGHAPVGLAEGRRQVELLFDPPHIGVYGTTGSGKTETVRSMICSLADAYLPDELQILLMDLKGKYANFHNLAHFHGWPIARSDQEFDQMLGYAGQQLKERETRSIFDARRIVLVMDEAEAILNRPRLATARALVQRGREVRINMLLATQEPHKGNYPQIASLINNIWCGLVKDARTSVQVTGFKGLACHLLSGPGDFVHAKGGGQYDRLLVALATRADYDRLPRAEISPPAVETSDPIDLDRLLPYEPPTWLDDDGAGAGRPRNEIEPETLAFYFHYHPDRISQAQARQEFGLSKYAHLQYKAFARRTLEKMRELRERGRSNGKTSAPSL